MSIIAIDFGKKRVGIAISVQNIAIPHKIVERHLIIDEIKKMIKERNISTIILGDPMNMDGSLSQTSMKVREFQNTLSSLFPDLKIILVDERLSSFEASFVNDKIGEKDDIAASLILASYLSSK
ncbi:MAG: Holliday junction resolvase RuvX [Candidatus Gracilibacteria bacterium]|nr:Holliday junction resolvase RuvX [Candidatus Gracilibacteria bacterium]